MEYYTKIVCESRYCIWPSWDGGICDLHWRARNNLPVMDIARYDEEKRCYVRNDKLAGQDYLHENYILRNYFKGGSINFLTKREIDLQYKRYLHNLRTRNTPKTLQERCRVAIMKQMPIYKIFRFDRPYYSKARWEFDYDWIRKGIDNREMGKKYFEQRCYNWDETDYEHCKQFIAKLELPDCLKEFLIN